MSKLDHHASDQDRLEALRMLAEAGLAGGAAAMTVLSAARKFATSLPA